VPDPLSHFIVSEWSHVRVSRDRTKISEFLNGHKRSVKKKGNAPDVGKRATARCGECPSMAIIDVAP
jgi:hypothetical protein